MNGSRFPVSLIGSWTALLLALLVVTAAFLLPLIV